MRIPKLLQPTPATETSSEPTLRVSIVAIVCVLPVLPLGHPARGCRARVVRRPACGPSVDGIGLTLPAGRGGSVGGCPSSPDAYRATRARARVRAVVDTAADSFDAAGGQLLTDAATLDLFTVRATALHE